MMLMLFLLMVLMFGTPAEQAKLVTLYIYMIGATYFIFIFILTQLFCCCPILYDIVCLFASIYAWSGFRTKRLRDCDAIGGTLWPRGCHIQSVTATVDHAGTFVPAGVSSTGDLLLQVVAIAVMSAVIIFFPVRFVAAFCRVQSVLHLQSRHIQLHAASSSTSNNFTLNTN